MIIDIFCKPRNLTSNSFLFYINIISTIFNFQNFPDIAGIVSVMSGGAGSQYYSLRWNNHPLNLVSVFTNLYQVGAIMPSVSIFIFWSKAETLVDVTLAAGGRQLQAHKVVLSACSEYFQSVFASNPCQVKYFFSLTSLVLPGWHSLCFSIL